MHHVHLLVGGAALERFLGDLRGLHEVPLNEELRTVQGVAKRSLRILTVKDISELI
jgi:hypothetical protein